MALGYALCGRPVRHVVAASEATAGRAKFAAGGWGGPKGGGFTLFYLHFQVRHWSLDPEKHTAEAYVVTPPERAERQVLISNR